MPRHPIIRALLKDRKARDESRNAQAKRIGIRESSLRTTEAAKAPHRGTLALIAAALGIQVEAK